MKRGALSEIDLGALEGNLKAAARVSGGRPVIAVVKADAYGHGAEKVAKTLEAGGAYALAVAFTDEAIALREAGIRLPILVLFDKSDIPSLFEHNLTPVVHDLAFANALSKEARKRGNIIGVHIKADTGMGRMGFGSAPDILKAASLPNIKVSGLMSHFSDSDPDYCSEQLRAFSKIKSALAKLRIRPLCHMANSHAMVSVKGSLMDAVRPGLFLYGVPPSGAKGITPVMSVKARIIALRKIAKGKAISYGRTFITARPTLTAVLAIGYADGYMRALSSKASVIISGARAPVLGKVCMDLTVVDATDINNVKEGGFAVIMGGKGKERVPAWEIAERAGTVPYEILTSFGHSSIRKWTGGGN